MQPTQQLSSSLTTTPSPTPIIPQSQTSGPTPRSDNPEAPTAKTPNPRLPRVPKGWTHHPWQKPAIGNAHSQRMTARSSPHRGYKNPMGGIMTMVESWVFVGPVTDMGVDIHDPRASLPGGIYLTKMSILTNDRTQAVFVSLFTGSGYEETLGVVPHESTLVWSDRRSTTFLAQTDRGAPPARLYIEFQLYTPDAKLGNPKLVTVTNTSVPVAFPSTGGSLPVTVSNEPITVHVAQAGHPLWVSEFAPKPEPKSQSSPTKPGNRRVRSSKRGDDPDHQDLMLSGDVESNPGPGVDLSFDAAALNINVASFQSDRAVVVDAPPVPSANPDLDRMLRNQAAMNDHEGVEPEWDLTMVRSRILDRAGVSAPVAQYFQAVAVFSDLADENIFACLATDIPTELTCDRDPDEYDILLPDRPRQRTSPAKTLVSAGADSAGQAKPPRTGTNDTSGNAKAATSNKNGTPLTRAEIKARVDAVVTRISLKLSKHPLAAAIWLKKSPARFLVEMVWKRMLGRQWVDDVKFTEVHLMGFCYINNVPTHVFVAKAVEYDQKYDEFSHVFANLRADLEAANLHNKLMHATNGNILTQGMADIDAAPEWKSVLGAARRICPQYSGYEAQAAITNVVGDTNPNQSNLFDQDRLRGNVVGDNNIIASNVVQTLPTTNMIPRLFYTVGTDGQEWTPHYRMPITEVNMAEYYANPIMASDLSQILSDSVKNNQTSNWRRDNTTLAGFSSFDVISVNTTLIPKGLSLETMLLKLDLLHSILAMKTKWHNIGRSVWNLLNPTLNPTQADATLGINDSPVAPTGESSGGTTAVFPFGGSVGEIAFHLTLQSVPIDRRDDAIFLPPGLLQASRDASEAIALFVCSWAEWPFGIYTVTKAVDYVGPLDPDQTTPPQTKDLTYLPMQTLTRVPGQTRMDIILPRRCAEANPTNQAAANEQSVVRPTWGPRATTNGTANSQMNIAFMGADGVTTYNLAEYLVSWATQFNTVGVKQYLGRLGVMLGIRDTALSVHEMNTALCQIAPQMELNDGVAAPFNFSAVNITTDNAIRTTRLTPITDVAYTNHCQLTMLQASTDETVPGPIFPIKSSVSADYRIYETSPSVWNKVILGLATAPNLNGEPLNMLPAHYGDPRVNLWERLDAIPMMVSWGVYYVLFQMTAAAWDSGYTSNDSQWIQNRVRQTFCTSHRSGTILPARFAQICRTLQQEMFNRTPVTAVTSVGGSPISITHYERWLPGSTYASTWTVAGLADDTPPVWYDCFVPVLLTDLYLQYFADKVPRAISAFPPPFGSDSTQGYNHDLIVHRNNTLGLVGPYLEKELCAVYPMNEGPQLSDAVLWNIRLWFSSPSYQPLNYAGGSPAEVFPQPALKPIGRQVPLLPGEAHPTGLARMNTVCFPSIDTTGARIIPYLTAAESVRYIQACNRAIRLAMPAWLLNKIMIEPKIQSMSAARDIMDTFTVDVQEQDFQTAVAEKVVKATVAEVAQQAVDVATLPSSSVPATAMEQPSSSAD